MICSILEIFRVYQTFFTGVLGFTGVIITMIVNARHQTRLQYRQMEHDVRSLRVALKSELVANKKTYEGRVQTFNEPSELSHALIPSNIVDYIYKTHLDKVGLLSEEEVEKTLRAYLLIAELPYRLRILVGTDNVGGFNDEFIRLDKSRQPAAKRMHEAFLPPIQEAIDSIDQHLGK
jgi:hypothetical protein